MENMGQSCLSPNPASKTTQLPPASKLSLKLLRLCTSSRPGGPVEGGPQPELCPCSCLLIQDPWEYFPRELVGPSTLWGPEKAFSQLLLSGPKALPYGSTFLTSLDSAPVVTRHCCLTHNSCQNRVISLLPSSPVPEDHWNLHAPSHSLTILPLVPQSSRSQSLSLPWVS